MQRISLWECQIVCIIVCSSACLASAFCYKGPSEFSHQAMESYITTETHKCYAMMSGPHQLFMVYGEGIPTYAMRSITQKTLSLLTKDRNISVWPHQIIYWWHLVGPCFRNGYTNGTYIVVGLYVESIQCFTLKTLESLYYFKLANFL